MLIFEKQCCNANFLNFLCQYLGILKFQLLVFFLCALRCLFFQHSCEDWACSWKYFPLSENKLESHWKPVGHDVQVTVSSSPVICKNSKPRPLCTTSQVAYFNRNLLFHGSAGRSPKPRCQQSQALSETSGESFLAFGGLLATFDVPWLVCLSPQTSPSHCLLPVSQASLGCLLMTPVILDYGPTLSSMTSS